jgi:hypothetical protein
MSTGDLTALREKLVEDLRELAGTISGAVVGALRSVPRHVFVPEVPPETAYRDEAIVTKRDPDGHPISSSSQPMIMAMMLEQHMRAWDGIGRPGNEGMRIDAYPKSTPDRDLADRMIIEKRNTRLALSWPGHTPVG